MSSKSAAEGMRAARLATTTASASCAGSRLRRVTASMSRGSASGRENSADAVDAGPGTRFYYCGGGLQRSDYDDHHCRAMRRLIDMCGAVAGCTCPRVHPASDVATMS